MAPMEHRGHEREERDGPGRSWGPGEPESPPLSLPDEAGRVARDQLDAGAAAAFAAARAAWYAALRAFAASKGTTPGPARDAAFRAWPDADRELNRRVRELRQWPELRG